MNTNKISVYVIILFVLLFYEFSAAQTCDFSKKPSTPSERFIIHKDRLNGAVTDTVTNLMWTRSIVLGAIDGLNDYNIMTMKWREAMLYAKKSKFLGFDNWRLPSLRELKTIIEKRCNSPAINLEVFLNFNNYLVWTSDFYNTRNGAYYAKIIDFKNGKSYYDYQVASNHILLTRNIKK